MSGRSTLEREPSLGEVVDARIEALKNSGLRSYRWANYLSAIAAVVLLAAIGKAGLVLYSGVDILEGLDASRITTPLAILGAALILGFFHVRHARLNSNRALNDFCTQARLEAAQGLEWARMERERLGMRAQPASMAERHGDR